MNIIIIGAGNVGFTSAETLSTVHNVMIIEKDNAKADAIKNMLNVSVLHEDGTNPRVLESAIKKHDADLIVSTLASDGMNLFVCITCKGYRPSLRTVATIKNPDYVIKTTAEGNEGVDMIISPEIISSNKIFKLATLENVVDYEIIKSLDIAIATFRVTDDQNIVGKIILNIDIPKKCDIVCIYRGDEVITDVETVEIRSEDRITVIGNEDSIEAFNKMIGIKDEALEFVIMGAGVVGMNVAKALSKMDKKVYVKIIEEDKDLCREASRNLTDAIVVNSDIIDPHILKTENVGRADVLISVTDADEKNLLACMASLKFGTRKVISRYLTRQYKDIFSFTGIETIIGYHLIIANEITKGLISEEESILKMKHDKEYFFSVKIDVRTPIFGKLYGDLSIPEGVRFAAVVRDGKTIYLKYDTEFREGDRVLVYTYMAKGGAVKKLLGKEMLGM
ncbi:MAG TPA: NAD-binding protein [Candidatus Methanomethylophilaceae archaeon]|nr:NAD-binding protein [Candidatus Methanomethylophilaceae archaeon]